MKIPDEILKQAWMAGSAAGRKAWIKKHPKDKDSYKSSVEEAWGDRSTERGFDNRRGIKAAAEVILKWFKARMR